VAALAEVHRQDGYPSRWPVRPEAWLSPSDLIEAWVAVADGAVAGHLALAADVEVMDINVITAAGWPSAEMASVSRLFVRPAFQGGGIGQRLLETATAFAVRHDIGLVLDVVDAPHSAAIALYERLGWRDVGRRRADWVTPGGLRPQLRIYVGPVRPSRR
jgi:GNAT superfamily N-acetyltransferase